jgi:hypothetical protein
MFEGLPEPARSDVLVWEKMRIFETRSSTEFQEGKQ